MESKFKGKVNLIAIKAFDSNELTGVTFKDCSGVCCCCKMLSWICTESIQFEFYDVGNRTRERV